MQAFHRQLQSLAQLGRLLNSICGNKAGTSVSVRRTVFFQLDPRIPRSAQLLTNRYHLLQIQAPIFLLVGAYIFLQTMTNDTSAKQAPLVESLA